MKYLAVLGRQPEISLAELESLFDNVQQIGDQLATFDAEKPNINRLGGTIKLAVELGEKPLDYLKSLPDGKITLGVSDYSAKSSPHSAKTEALKLKQILVRHNRSVRVVESKDAILSTATSLHNGLSGKNDRKCELIKLNNDWYRVIGVQDIDAYTKRDQARPMRDARVGMLPPKLAQILINLCGPLSAGSRILDPFCGTGVLLQEALLMGYTAYGTDVNERMVEYSEKNLGWLLENSKELLLAHFAGYDRELARSPRNARPLGREWPKANGRERRGDKSMPFELSVGDATNFQWTPPIAAVACEGYLGTPMSTIPTEIKLKEQKQECKSIILGFLKNLASQITPNTPVVIAVPAWLREDHTYSHLNIIDEITELGYNVKNTSREGLLYHRKDQIVARDIIILRKN